MSELTNNCDQSRRRRGITPFNVAIITRSTRAIRTRFFGAPAPREMVIALLARAAKPAGVIFSEARSRIGRSKMGSIVAGMVAGADRIDNWDVLRHGGMEKAFGGVAGSRS